MISSYGYIIRYEGRNDIIVFRYPMVGFNKKMQLYVQDKQEAIVYLNGIVKGLYITGAYILEPNSIEDINRCEVYFISKLLIDNISWVTTQINIQDKKRGKCHSFWLQGCFSMSVGNSYKLLEIIGDKEYFTIDSLKEHFKERINNIISEELSSAFVCEKINREKINSCLTDLSEKISTRIKPTFEKIGLMLEEFRFDTLNIEKDTKYDEYNDYIVKSPWYDKRMYDLVEKQLSSEQIALMMTGAGYGMGQLYNGMFGGEVAAFKDLQGNLSCSGVDSHVGIAQPHKIKK